ncbi:ribbon-helix-helix protein, CopG family [Oceaniglobus trochenteri]|uniref:ribbon-helix-helix protein, CopG family n=1 Tax=Oceaniglobus trochenteri TaxID=2763260 RepID=UPI001CFFD953|nr:ribbon-helix-helix protein, CopG family [Oceaniglobus trochenteri]
MTLKMPDEMVRALEEIAAREDVTPGQIVRDAIARDLRRRCSAKSDGRSDEALVAPLRSLLADELAFSESWEALQSALARKGFTLREAGGGLVLYAIDSGARLCKGSELGYSHLTLARRFGQPFPGHGNAFQVRRQMGYGDPPVDQRPGMS